MKLLFDREREREREREKTESALTREQGKGDENQNLRTRASEVSPAMAMPTCSSILNTFFWYEASSEEERWGKKGF